MGFNKPTTKLTLALTSTYFAIGFCGSMSDLVFESASIFGLTINSTNWISLTYVIASFVGVLATWPMGTALNLGRRIVTLVGLLLLFLGCILATALTAFGVVIASQVFYGMGIGSMYISGLLWMVEMAQAKNRGRRVVMMWIASAAGSAIASWIRFGFQFAPYTVGVRVPLGLQLLVLSFPIFFVWRADESWRWLLRRNQPDKARAILANHMPTSASASEFQQAFAAIVDEYRQSSGSRTLFSRSTSPGSPQLRPWRRLFLAFMLQTISKCCGYPVANQYLAAAAQVIVKSRYGGYTVTSALNMALPTFSFAFSIIPYFLVDRPSFSIFAPFERRGLLLLSALGLFGTFLLATVVSAATGNFDINSFFTGSGVTTSLITGYFVIFLVAILFYDLGFRAVTDLFTTEIVAGNVRSETLSITLAWGIGVELAIAIAVGDGTFTLGAYSFVIWLFLNLVWVALIFLFYPETQGRSLEVLDRIFTVRLKFLARMDREARRGHNVDGGLREFDSLGNESGYEMGADLRDESREEEDPGGWKLDDSR